MLTLAFMHAAANPIQTAYNMWASSYDTDANRTRDLDAQVTQAAISPMRFTSAIEAGCGTGKNTVWLARMAHRVHALDFSDGMLAQARNKVRDAHVTFTQANLTQSWPCADASADLVLCNLVLEHIENIDFVFTQAARCLNKGGLLWVCELHPFRQYDGTKARIVREGTTTLVDAYMHHVSDFTRAAKHSGLTLEQLQEHWHADDAGKPPRLLALMLRK
jgi:ubiquinone/menaquinone biosynthesis C-methylase UbiE